MKGFLLGIAALLLFVLPFAVLFLGFLAVPLLTGLYFLIQQPLGSPTSSILCGGTLTLAGALILGWILVQTVWRLIPHRAPSAIASFTLPDDLFSTPAHTYSLVIRQSWRDAILSFTIPLLLSVGGALALIGMFSQQPPPSIHGPDVYAMSGAMLSGLAGVITLIFRLGYGVRSVTTIQATAQGLRAQHPWHTLDLPWEAVETLKLSKASDRPRVYSVSGDTGKIAIAWRADTPRINDLDGAVPLSAGELAALIERRTGITLKEETE
jgi:hypothetical protein